MLAKRWQFLFSSGEIFRVPDSALSIIHECTVLVKRFSGIFLIYTLISHWFSPYFSVSLPFSRFVSLLGGRKNMSFCTDLCAKGRWLRRSILLKPFGKCCIQSGHTLLFGEAGPVNVVNKTLGVCSPFAVNTNCCRNASVLFNIYNSRFQI